MTRTPMEELEALLSEATDGKWSTGPNHVVRTTKENVKGLRELRFVAETLGTKDGTIDYEHVCANARLIAFAPTAVSELIAERLENERLEKELADLREANAWVEIEEIENYFDFSKMEEHEAHQEVAFSAMEGEWEMCRLSIKCDYDDFGEPLLPSIFTYGQYVSSEFIKDSGFTHFRVIHLPSSPPVEG